MAISQIGRFCQWLEQTSLSQSIQSASWVVPTVQTVHILAISAVMGSALMLNLRLMNFVGREQSLQSIATRFAPVIWAALPVLFLTGAVLTVGEPARELLNPVFRLKMVLIVAAAGLLAYFQIEARRNPSRFDGSGGSRTPAFLLAIISMTLWTAVVLSGRWIAYI